MTGGGTETPEIRRKRLRMRAWHRGIKEMDLILGGYADAHLQTLDGPALDTFEAALEENDHDLFAWVTGRAEAPARYAELVAALGQGAAAAR